ncbi:hypothetical protein [Agromyces sp. C10]|jgi:hypothetical protein|uniref:hypothetical protein n=1 Tax=Agromyces sp. C10 TaxID=2935077 RepID=UPI00200A3F64|nr:hypothetical protein [Agromyces sp. C10]MCK8607894.1 hypothetical protein [Agromyces sp. C10]
MIHSGQGKVQSQVLGAPDGQAAIQQYLDHAAAVLADDPETAPPEPAPFFEHLQPFEGRLIVGSSPASEEFSAARLLCPGGNGECWRERVGSGASARWVWVCNCY